MSPAETGAGVEKGVPTSQQGQAPTLQSAVCYKTLKLAFLKLPPTCVLLLVVPALGDFAA